MTVLLNYFEQEKARYRETPQDAADFLNVGEYPRSKNKDLIGQAALMSVVHSLYNLEESIMKN